MYTILPPKFDLEKATLESEVRPKARKCTVVFELICNSYSTVRRALVGEEIGKSSFLVSTDDGEREIDELLAYLGHREVRDGLVEEFRLVLEQLGIC